MKSLIDIRNLNHYFGKGYLKKQILFNINLDIVHGQIVLMTGPSGSGKNYIVIISWSSKNGPRGKSKDFKSTNEGCE